MVSSGPRAGEGKAGGRHTVHFGRQGHAPLVFDCGDANNSMGACSTLEQQIAHFR